jgi:type I restriction enzyme S subunit
VRNGRPPTLATGWQWRRFGDCAQFINGRAYSQEELLDEGTPVLRIQNLNGSDRWYYSNLKLPDEKYCEAGDLLYAWSASFGPYRFNGPKSIFHYHIWRVIPGQELDKDFAFHLLEEITAEVKSAAHGVAMLHMTKGGIEAWQIPLPPLAEQRRIAEVLDRAEALRAKRRAALAQLDSLTQSIFLDLFGRPTVRRTRWPVSTLGEVCLKITDGTHHSPPTHSTGVPYVTAKHLKEHGLDFESDPWFVTEDDHRAIYSRCDPKPGDVLYIKDGATTGLAAINLYEFPFSMLSSLALLRTNTNRIESAYLCHWLNNPLVKQETVGGMAGVAIRRLTLAKIKAIGIPVPPIELQREFSRRVTAVEKLKAARRASLAELDALFASLQHRAFRGEL